MIPNPVRLFHITAIDNLAGICQAGGLVCKNTCAGQGIQYQNIAHAGAQGARGMKLVPNPPGGTIHDYVPFYYAPRSPMLYAINGGRVEGCTLRQNDILHFETTVPRLLGVTGDIVFYDRNATLQFSVAYTDPAHLAEVIAWELITEAPRLDGFCKYFHNIPSNQKYVDRMEKRQAEFLVKQQVPLEAMTRIGVINEQKALTVRGILDTFGIQVTVEVMPEWYF